MCQGLGKSKSVDSSSIHLHHYDTSVSPLAFPSIRYHLYTSNSNFLQTGLLKPKHTCLTAYHFQVSDGTRALLLPAYVPSNLSVLENSITISECLIPSSSRSLCLSNHKLNISCFIYNPNHLSLLL